MICVMERIGKARPGHDGATACWPASSRSPPRAPSSSRGRPRSSASIAGILVVEAVLFIERLEVDDPVGAISVHGVSGIWGVIAVGLFANGKYGAGWNGTSGAAAKAPA